MRVRILLAAVLAGSCLPGTALAQQVTRENVAGIRNFARLETTVACTGAITPESVPEIKKMGFAAIINLRLASENGAEIEKAQAAATAAGIRYIHIPWNGSPDPAAAEKFLDAITSSGAQPALIACASGNRAATMWLIKRIAVDRWDVDKATAEAIALGQASATARQFAIDYARTHQR